MIFLLCFWAWLAPSPWHYSGALVGLLIWAQTKNDHCMKLLWYWDSHTYISPLLWKNIGCSDLGIAMNKDHDIDLIKTSNTVKYTVNIRTVLSTNMPTNGKSGNNLFSASTKEIPPYDNAVYLVSFQNIFIDCVVFRLSHEKSCSYKWRGRLIWKEQLIAHDTFL